MIAGCQTHWTKEVSEALIENKIEELYKALMAQVNGLCMLVQKFSLFLSLSLPFFCLQIVYLWPPAGTYM